MGLRERVFHSAQGRDKEGRIDEFKKKKKKKERNTMLETQSVESAEWRDRARGNIRVADKT